jgi:hypothetical protein
LLVSHRGLFATATAIATAAAIAAAIAVTGTVSVPIHTANNTIVIAAAGVVGVVTAVVGGSACLGTAGGTPHPPLHRPGVSLRELRIVCIRNARTALISPGKGGSSGSGSGSGGSSGVSRGGMMDVEVVPPLVLAVFPTVVTHRRGVVMVVMVAILVVAVVVTVLVVVVAVVVTAHFQLGGSQVGGVGGGLARQG